MPIQQGDRVRVDISGTIGRYRESIAATNEVRETGAGWTHFIFTGSQRVLRADGSTRPEDKSEGSEVRAVFTGEITGEPGSGTFGTTLVREVLPEGGFGLNHYLFLPSEGITKLEKTTTATTQPRRKGTTMIDRYDSTIDDGDVDNRIEELEGFREFEVTRTRNDEVLATFGDEDEAEQYIQDEDYDSERVVVRESELDIDDQRELDNLTELRSDMGGESVTYTLYNDSYFTEDWARQEALDTLGSRIDLDDWPLSLIDWGEAADEHRDDLYESTVEFGGQTFYYSE